MTNDFYKSTFFLEKIWLLVYESNVDKIKKRELAKVCFLPLCHYNSFGLIVFFPGCIVSWIWVSFAGAVGNLARLDMAGQGTSVQRRPVWESSQRDNWEGWSCWHVDPVTPLWSPVWLPVFFFLFDKLYLANCMYFNGKLFGNRSVVGIRSIFCLCVGLPYVLLW